MSTMDPVSVQDRRYLPGSAAADQSLMLDGGDQFVEGLPDYILSIPSTEAPPFQLHEEHAGVEQANRPATTAGQYQDDTFLFESGLDEPVDQVPLPYEIGLTNKYPLATHCFQPTPPTNPLFATNYTTSTHQNAALGNPIQGPVYNPTNTLQRLLVAASCDPSFNLVNSFVGLSDALLLTIANICSSLRASNQVRGYLDQHPPLPPQCEPSRELPDYNHPKLSNRASPNLTKRNDPCSPDENVEEDREASEKPKKQKTPLTPGKKRSQRVGPKTPYRRFHSVHPERLDWTAPLHKGPTFTYTSEATWTDNLLLSADDIYTYIKHCPRKLTIWIQHHPAQILKRPGFQRADLRCRWIDCPANTGLRHHGTIKAGFRRVVFDEFTEHTNKCETDPLKVAGVMHLWCFEQCFDAGLLYAHGILQPDNRSLVENEYANHAGFERAPSFGATVEALRPWMDKWERNWLEEYYGRHGALPDMCFTALPDKRPAFVPRAHKDTLSWLLTYYHIQIESGGRQNTRDGRNTKQVYPNSLDHHMGDLAYFILQEEARKVKNKAKTGKRKRSGNQAKVDAYDEASDSEPDIDPTDQTQQNTAVLTRETKDCGSLRLCKTNPVPQKPRARRGKGRAPKDKAPDPIPPPEVPFFQRIRENGVPPLPPKPFSGYVEIEVDEGGGPIMEDPDDNSDEGPPAKRQATAWSPTKFFLEHQRWAEGVESSLREPIPARC